MPTLAAWNQPSSTWVSTAGQLHAADLVVHAGTEQPALGEPAQRRGDLVVQDDAAVDELRLLAVVAAVVRREVAGRDLLGQVEDGVEGLAGVLGEARARGQRLDVEPLVEQEVEVTAGQQERGHARQATDVVEMLSRRSGRRSPRAAGRRDRCGGRTPRSCARRPSARPGSAPGGLPRLGTTRSRSLPASASTGRVELGEVGVEVRLGGLGSGVGDVQADTVGVVREPQVLAIGVHPHPPPLDLGHVTHEPQQRELRRRDRLPGQLLTGQARALQPQGGAVELQPLLERGALVGDEVRPVALDVRGGSSGHWSRVHHGQRATYTLSREVPPVSGLATARDALPRRRHGPQDGQDPLVRRVVGPQREHPAGGEALAQPLQTGRGVEVAVGRVEQVVRRVVDVEQQDVAAGKAPRSAPARRSRRAGRRSAGRRRAAGSGAAAVAGASR